MSDSGQLLHLNIAGADEENTRKKMSSFGGEHEHADTDTFALSPACLCREGDRLLSTLRKRHRIAAAWPIRARHHPRELVEFAFQA